jgi:uncharacterized membrane protein
VATRTDPEQLRRHKPSARTQVMAATLVGIVVGIVAQRILNEIEFATLIGWDAATIVLIGSVWAVVWRLDAAETSALATHQDPTRAEADLIVLSASVASLVAVGFGLVSAANASGTAQALRIGLGVASVALSWTVVHTLFTLRYARLYYTGEDGGVDFPGGRPPAYQDFAYLSFTIGMTFQVSDTDLEAVEIRRTALQHCLLSYVFGTGILATSINLVASLSSQ